MCPVNETTRLLKQIGDGSDSAADRLFPLVYEELRGLAEGLFSRERPSHTLQPTALVNEAYLKLLGGTGVTWSSRAHFFAVAARAMRRILIDHARRKNAGRRGGGWGRTLLEDVVQDGEISEADLLALNDAMERLADKDARKARVVELRFFAGLSVKEVAHVLEVSKTTVEAEWRFARAWLSKRLREGDRG
jgi:RNA polymerase sigma factor (TIGR02999 family)